MTKTTVSRDVLMSAVHLACRAPSYHNSQPWRWVADGAELHLHLDAGQLVASDSSGRQALISCGAVLDHLRVAAAAAGWTANVDRYPNPNNHRHIATIDFTAMEFVTDGHRRRAEAILRRRTDRLPFAAPTDWQSLEPALRRTIADIALLDVLTDDARPRLAEASRLTEAIRLYDSSYHAELSWWTTPFESTTGIPHSSLVSAAESNRVDIGRNFPVTHHRERRTDVPEDRSTIVVLSAHSDAPVDVLACGEALSAVLLDATMADMATCTLTHMTELQASRDIIAGLTGREWPEVLVRVGTTPAMEGTPPPTPRRPLSDVLAFA